eukprot:2655155-Rhodomonas_salina.1
MAASRMHSQAVCVTGRQAANSEANHKTDSSSSAKRSTFSIRSRLRTNTNAVEDPQKSISPAGFASSAPS